MIGIGFGLPGITLYRRGYRPTFLLRDDFLTDESAPLTSPRTAEPGPGTLTLVQTDGQFSISGGELVIPAQSTPAWGDLGLYDATARSRADGRALVGTLNLSTWEAIGLGWHGSAAVADPDTFVHAIQANTTDGRLDNQHGAQIATGLSTSTDYPLALVMGATRTKHLARIGGDWKMLWVDTDTTASVYAAMSNFDAVGTLGDFRVTDLPAPWNDDYGIATERLAGVRTPGDTFAHEADCIIEFTATTIGTNSGHLPLLFRRTDDDNCWRIRMTPGGGIFLEETVAGSTTARGSVANGTLLNGHRVVVIADGATIRVYSNNVLRITYTSASNFADQTNGKILNMSDGSYSDYESWPRTISGAAKSYLDAVVA